MATTRSVGCGPIDVTVADSVLRIFLDDPNPLRAATAIGRGAAGNVSCPATTSAITICTNRPSDTAQAADAVVTTPPVASHDFAGREGDPW